MTPDLKIRMKEKTIAHDLSVVSYKVKRAQNPSVPIDDFITAPVINDQ